LMLREPLRMVSAGSLVGGLLSLVLIRAIWPLLAGDQSGLAPLTLIAVFALMLAVGMAAALRPASRAASTDPMSALRQE
jgi:ABC-type antimicrobial peptide transport system permease subunit